MGMYIRLIPLEILFAQHRMNNRILSNCIQSMTCIYLDTDYCNFEIFIDFTFVIEQIE